MPTVVAALISRNSKLLVCQRKRNDTHPLQWEFPGGKKRPAETGREALERELLEELGVSSIIGEEILRVRHQYPQMREPIELIFFAASLDARKIQNLAFETMDWRLPSDLSALDFLPADRDLIQKLASGELQIPRFNPPNDSR